MSPITSGRYVDCTWRLMRRTASSPAVTSTPASAYVSFFGSAEPGSDKVGRRQVVALEHALAQGDGNVDGILAAHARGAEPGAGHADRSDQVVQGDVRQRVDAEVILDLADGHVRRDQLGTRARVHAVEARPPVRRAHDPEVHLGGARLAQ